MRPIPATAAIRIDASRAADFPLSKERIAVYNSGLVPIERYRRDAHHLAGTVPESLRIDLGWGAEWMPWTREVVTADQTGNLSFDFAETDDIARVLVDAGTRPYWSYSYVPKAARPSGGDWRTMAADDTTWVRTVAAYVAGMRERGITVGYHEVYNEPDLRDERTGDATFYTGGLHDYLDLYRATATAIRAADANARVGGPALAVTAVNSGWLEAFCQMVVAERLPLDFLSFHHYGHFGLDSTLRIVRETLTRHPALRHTELHLNEYNAFSIDYPRGGLQDGHHLAAAFAAELPRLLAQRDLTRTHWAQYLDSGEGNFSGMVDIDGHPKPIHAVYDFYQQMPIDRIACDVQAPPGVGAIASTGTRSAAAIVWNRNFGAVEVTLDLAGVPAGAPLRMTRINSDGVHDLEERTPATSHRVRLSQGEVVLLASGEPTPRPTRRHAWGVPVAPPSPAHGWTDLDEATTTFRFRSGGVGWLSHGADILDGEPPERWQVTARSASGTPAPANVVMHLDDGRTRRSWTIAGDAAEPHLDPPDRPRPVGAARIYASVDAPAGCYVTIVPATGADR